MLEKKVFIDQKTVIDALFLNNLQDELIGTQKQSNKAYQDVNNLDKDLQRLTQARVILSNDNMPTTASSVTGQFQLNLVGNPSLVEGDVIIGKNGYIATIQSIEYDQEGRLYDITVMGTGQQLTKGYIIDVTDDYASLSVADAISYINGLPEGRYYLKDLSGKYYACNVDVSGVHYSEITFYEDDGYIYRYVYIDGILRETWESSGDGDAVSVSAQQIADNTKRINQIDEKINTLSSNVGKTYGFHIDSSEADPDAAITYLVDAVGMTPAAMDFTNGKFLWGSWRDAFFLPRPCMLRYDGTVDYYLDENDYAKKYDGTPSDVANDAYEGNAMMEWGRNGRKIWYKIIPVSSDPTSADVYIADYQVDESYHAWSFINNQGELVDHFYTPIYNGSLDSSGKLRSISGKGYNDLCQSKTASEEITSAEQNNPGTDKLWYTEVFCDVMLIDLLLILMAKSLNMQESYGQGRCVQNSNAASMLGTGTMNDKGLFWGSSKYSSGVKIFGMENWWGNQWRRYSGHMMINYIHKIKLTRGIQDGSTAEDYNTTGDGYLTGAVAPRTNDYVSKMHFDDNCFLTSDVGGDSAHNWCDFWHQNSGSRYSFRGGACHTSAGFVGAFYDNLSNNSAHVGWAVGAAPSCKPLY